MAGRDVNAGNAAQITDREGQLRCRAERLEIVRPNAVGRQRQRRFPGKFRRHMTGIVGDGHTLVLTILRQDIIGQTLCCLSDHIDIHTVRAGADDTAQAGCPELKIIIKTFTDLFVIIRHRPQFGFGSFVEIRILKPCFIGFQITHTFSSRYD